MNENQTETENKTKMQCNDINERKKRYLQENKFSSLIIHAFGEILYFEVVTSLWRRKGNIDNADVIKINI